MSDSVASVGSFWYRNKFKNNLRLNCLTTKNFTELHIFFKRKVFFFWQKSMGLSVSFFLLSLKLCHYRSELNFRCSHCHCIEMMKYVLFERNRFLITIFGGSATAAGTLTMCNITLLVVDNPTAGR